MKYWTHDRQYYDRTAKALGVIGFYSIITGLFLAAILILEGINYYFLIPELCLLMLSVYCFAKRKMCKLKSYSAPAKT